MRHFLLAFILCISFSVQAYALEEVTLDHDGRKRLFLVHVPNDMKGRKNLPVVMALHGGGGSAEQFSEHIKMHETANKYGFIAVYPQGTSKRGKMYTWNAGRCCSSAMEENVDDVGYISKVIDNLVRDYGADSKRIYSTGHSNGAMMSYRLACELSDKIAAIAPNGGQDMKRESCPLKRAVPVMHMHGKLDKCAVYAGKQQCGGCFQEVLRSVGLPVKGKPVGGTCHPVPEMVAQWGRFNGCSGLPTVTLQKGQVHCESYEGCRDGAEVTLCTAENAGHTWAGSSDSMKVCQRRPNGRLCKAWKAQAGQTNMDVSANVLFWDFFQKHKID